MPIRSYEKLHRNFVAQALYKIDLLCSRISAKRGVTRAIFLSDGISEHTESQFDCFSFYRRGLRTDLGFIFTHRTIELDRLPKQRFLQSFDIIGLKCHYKAPKNQVLATATELARIKSRTARLIYFDGNDEASIQWPELLGVCDVYWKRHVLRDRIDAIRLYEGSTNLTHHVLGLSAADAPPAPIDHSWLERIKCGASIALDRKTFTLGAHLGSDEPQPAHAERSYDAVLRADIPDNWMGELRAPAMHALEKLGARFKVVVPSERVRPNQYVNEMRQSRICVSPFGYGEICYRDFEAIAYGCLLVKPDMAHIESYPDIYQPFETYVPVRWDFADFEDTVSRYLQNESERLRIVRNARRVLRESHSPGWFVQQAARLISAAKESPSQRACAD